MKTHKYLALIAVLLFAFANAYGQSNLSLDKTIEYAEFVRDLNGEKSEEYLKALDSVVQVAFLTNNQEVRYAYRSQYVGILEAMKGKNNRDYVNALWSLGYACEAIGDTTRAMGHYQECLSLLEKMMEVDESNETADFYIKCVYYVFRNYCASGDFEKADSLVEVLIQTTERVDGKFSCHYFGMLQEGAMVAVRLNHWDDFVNYSTITINNDKRIDSCNYSYINSAYDNLIRYNYFQMQRVDNSIMLASEYLQRLTTAGDGFLHEKANVLFWLNTLSSDINYSIECGKVAEQFLHACYNNQGELFQDPIYLPIVNNLATLSKKIGNYKDAVYYYTVCCNILLGNGMKDTYEYYEYLFNLFLSADLSDDYKLTLDVSKDLEGMIPMYSKNIDKDYYLFVSRLCNTHMHLLDYNEAMSYCDKLIELDKNVLQDTIRLAQTLSSKAQLYCYLENTEKAIETIHIGLALLNNYGVSPQSLSAKSRLLSLESQIIPNDFELSISKIDSALYIDQIVIEDIISGSDSSDPNLLEERNAYTHYAIDLQRKGDLYKGYDYRKVQFYYSKAVKLIEKYYSKNSVEYVHCMKTIAEVQILCYDYTEALNTLEEIKPYLIEIYGENSPEYADYLTIYANYYLATDSSKKALEHNVAAANINRLIYEENNFISTRYAYNLGRIGDILTWNQHYEEAADTLFKAMTMLNRIDGYLELKNVIKDGLADAWYMLGSYDKADSLYREILHSEEELYGKFSEQVAGTLNSWGYHLYYNKADADAFDCFSEAIVIYDSLEISDKGPKLIYLLARYVESGLVFNHELDTTLLEIITKNYENLYNRYITYYSANDREKLVRSLYPANNVFFNLITKYPIEKTLFEIELLSKSILLTTSQHFQKAILNSGRRDLIEQYYDIQALQMAIDNHSFGLSPEDQSTEVLNEQKNSKERDLILKMKNLGYASADSLSYAAVLNTLNPNEVAIEFVDYHHYLKGIPSSLQNERIKELMKECDKTYYIALLAKSSWDKPVYVQLCTEEELKACLGNPNVTYSNDDLYRLLWQPLSEYIDDSSTVYFSPSGMLHTIALESLHTPDGFYLSDKYNLVRLTSTRELCKAKQPKSYETGSIYGSLQYDVDQQRMTEVAAMNKMEKEESPAFALRGEDRGNWNYLQGTKDEAEHIAGIMRQANINCNLLEGDLGSEESFKALSGGNTDIIHLATHGYFLEGEKADMNDFMKSLSPLARQKTDSIIDPLLRSGLILSGGNSAWLGKEVPEGIEDGVLTALEISTMNLSGTDMVVMSACETGLGDITSDGVFGLQRAFKMAGVQTLVMSLWKVDDNATSLMMQTFYEHLLSGMSKREAFNLAQAAVRAKYTEPYYWAGFVMLD